MTRIDKLMDYAPVVVGVLATGVLATVVVSQGVSSEASPARTTATLTVRVTEPATTVTKTKTSVRTATKTKTVNRVVKRTVVNRSTVQRKPPVGYVLTSSGRLVKVWAECFRLNEAEVRPGSPVPDYAWKFCDADGGEWKDQPR